MRVTDRTVCVEVVDTAPGSDEAPLPRVFDRVFHANPDIEGSRARPLDRQGHLARYEGTATLRIREDGRSGIVARICLARDTEPRAR